MRIRLISKDNIVGLSHDVRVLSHAIALAAPDAEIEFVDWQQRDGLKRADINIFLELVGAQFLPLSDRNIYVPNPEWYYSEMWGAVLPRMTEVWAKTQDCQRIFAPLHRRTVFSGWTSEDRMHPRVNGRRYKALLHVAGASIAKGTDEVLEAMRGLPDLRLTMVAREHRWKDRLPPNVELLENPPDSALIEIQNEHLVHLCPSSYEGFGHYLNEARSVGAFIITTNASPMRDMVDDFGAAVGYATTSRQNLATHAHVSVPELRDTIAAVMAHDLETLANVGARGRKAYETERQAFHAFIEHALL